MYSFACCLLYSYKAAFFYTWRVMLRWTYRLISAVGRHEMQYCRSVLFVLAERSGWLVYLKGSSLSVFT